jgi:hypothetical protein
MEKYENLENIVEDFLETSSRLSDILGNPFNFRQG